MRRVAFAELSWGVRIILGLAAFNFWMSFEEFVINRSSLWRFLPGYRFASACVWDLIVGCGIAIGIWWFSIRRNVSGAAR